MAMKCMKGFWPSIFFLSSAWDWFLTQRLSTRVFGNALDVSFEEDPRSNFVDYNQFLAGASVNFVTSPTTTLSASVFRSRFKTPQIGSQTDSTSYQVGITHALDESLTINFRIGQ